MKVFSLTRLIGWAMLAGGGLSAILAALLFLGPMLGFDAFERQGPGPRSSGAVELPAALVAQAPGRGSPSAPTFALEPGTLATAFAPAAAAPAGPPAASTTGGGGQRGATSAPATPGPQPPAPVVPATPAAPAGPAAPATPAAPAAPAVSESVAQPAPASAPQPVAVSGRPTTNTFTASSEQDDAETRPSRDRGRTPDRRPDRAVSSPDRTVSSREEPVAAPVVEAEVGDSDDQGQDEDHGGAWERGRDNEDDHEGRGDDHTDHHESGRGWED